MGKYREAKTMSVFTADKCVQGNEEKVVKAGTAQLGSILIKLCGKVDYL